MAHYSLFDGDFVDQESGADFTFLSGDSAESEGSGFNGTGSFSLPSLTSSASGTFVSNDRTGTGAYTLPSLASSASGTTVANATGTGAYTLPSLTANANNTVTTVLSYYTLAEGDFTDNGLQLSIAFRDFTTASGAAVGNNFEASVVYTLASLTASASGVTGQTTRDGTPVTQLGATGPTGRRDFGGARTEAGFDGVAAYTLPSLTASGSSALGFIGTAAFALPSLSVDAVANYQGFGVAAYLLPSLSADAFGGVEVTGSISIGLPVLEVLAQYQELPGFWYDINESPGIWNNL